MNLPHQFKGNAEVFTEARVVQDMYNIVRAITVLLQEGVQYLQLDHRLLYKSLLIAYNFNGHIGVGLVIKRSNHLTEASLTDYVQNLITIGNMIMRNLQSFKPISIISTK